MQLCIFPCLVLQQGEGAAFRSKVEGLAFAGMLWEPEGKSMVAASHYEALKMLDQLYPDHESKINNETSNMNKPN